MFKEPTKKEPILQLVQQEKEDISIYFDAPLEEIETVSKELKEIIEIEQKEPLENIPVESNEVVLPLEEIVDDVIDETLAIEELEGLKEEIQEQELEQEINEAMEKQMTNNDLYNIALTIRNDLYDMKKDELKIDNAILRKLDDLNGNVKTVNDKYSKTTFSIMAVLSVLFLLIGMQSEVWLPYVGNLLDFARTTTNIIK